MGWQIKRTKGSHRTLSRSGFDDFTFAFHDDDEIGPKMLARIGKRTRPDARRSLSAPAPRPDLISS